MESQGLQFLRLVRDAVLRVEPPTERLDIGVVLL
jgi:hypothetical protein